VQEGIFNSLNLFHFSPSEDFRKKVRKVRWPMLWSVTIVALISNHPGVAGYEPFSAFFDSTGNAAQWIILGIAILMSMLVPRFYCQDFCPTGLVLNGTVHIHQNLRRRYHHPLPVVPAVQESSLAPQRGGSQAHKAAEIWHDKVYIIAASAVNLLIIVSLLENLGIL
jgi:hypothetical protein